MNADTMKRGDHVTTPDGPGVILMPPTPGWDRATVLVRTGSELPFERDYYPSELKPRA